MFFALFLSLNLSSSFLVSEGGGRISAWCLLHARRLRFEKDGDG